MAVAQFTKESVIAGAYKAGDAEALTRADFERLLPEGIHTQNHHLYEIIEVDQSATVGMAWLIVAEDLGKIHAYICDIYILPKCQNKGYGANAIRLLEIKAKEQFGASEIGLHVFYHNLPAQSLYNKMGYKPTGLSMKKFLNESV